MPFAFDKRRSAGIILRSERQFAIIDERTTGAASRTVAAAIGKRFLRRVVRRVLSLHQLHLFRTHYPPPSGTCAGERTGALSLPASQWRGGRLCLPPGSPQT